MMEYLKRKLCRLENDDSWKEDIPFPRYYEENGRIIKETENGEKYIIILDKNHKEVIAGKIK